MLGPEYCDQANHDPNRGGYDGYLCEHIACFGAEGARTTHATERTRQTATATALHEDKQNQKDSQERKQQSEKYVGHGGRVQDTGVGVTVPIV
jgi:hypothetical protein